MKELTYEDWQKNPTPREMWCWNVNVEAKVQAKVIYVIKSDEYPVITAMDNGVDLLRYKHCAEIEEQRRRTNKELAQEIMEMRKRIAELEKENAELKLEFSALKTSDY